MDFENGTCAIRYQIKNGVKSPMKVSFNKLGCQVFEYKILQNTKEKTGTTYNKSTTPVAKPTSVD